MSEDEESLLEECLRARREPKRLETFLDGYREERDELASLLDVANALAALPEPKPSCHVPSLARGLALSAAGEGKRFSSVRGRGVWLRAAVVFMSALVLVQITAYSASASIPGDLLYPLKLLTEKVAFHLTFSRRGKAELHITYADERLRELIQTSETGGKLNEHVLEQMLIQADEALRRGKRLPDEERSLVLKRLSCFCAFHGEALASLRRETSDPKARETLSKCVEECARRCAEIRQALSESDHERQQSLERQPPCVRSDCGATGVEKENVPTKNRVEKGPSDDGPSRSAP